MALFKDLKAKYDQILGGVIAGGTQGLANVQRGIGTMASNMQTGVGNVRAGFAPIVNPLANTLKQGSRAFGRLSYSQNPINVLANNQQRQQQVLGSSIPQYSASKKSFRDVLTAGKGKLATAGLLQSPLSIGMFGATSAGFQGLSNIVSKKPITRGIPQALGQGLNMGAIANPIIKATNPILLKGLNKLPFSNQLATRTAAGIGNVLQGEVLGKSGMGNNMFGRGIDFGIGFVGGKSTFQNPLPKNVDADYGDFVRKMHNVKGAGEQLIFQGKKPMATYEIDALGDIYGAFKQDTMINKEAKYNLKEILKRVTNATDDKLNKMTDKQIINEVARHAAYSGEWQYQRTGNMPAMGFAQRGITPPAPVRGSVKKLSPVMDEQKESISFIKNWLKKENNTNPSEIKEAHRMFLEAGGKDIDFEKYLSPRQKIVHKQNKYQDIESKLQDLQLERESVGVKTEGINAQLRKDINKIKSLMKQDKYASGDIETLRKHDSKLVERVLEGYGESTGIDYASRDSGELLDEILNLPIKPTGIGALNQELKTAKIDIDNARQGVFPEGYGVAGRFKEFPTGKATKVVFKENKPFQVEGGRQIGNTFKEKFNIMLEGNPRLKSYLGKFIHAKDLDGVMQGGKIQIKKIDDLQTLSHEIGHYIDIGLGRIFSGGKGRGGLISGNKVFKNELIAVTEAMSGKIVGSKNNQTYRRSSKELIAEFISAYDQNRKVAQELAPSFYRVFETGYKNDEQIKFAVDQMREWRTSFQPVKDYVDNLRQIPEIKGMIDSVEEGGNIVQNFWRKNIGDKVWSMIEKGVSRFSQTKVGSYLTENKGLNKTVETILDSRRRLIGGQIARIDQEIINPLKKLSENDSKAVAELMQKFDSQAGELGQLADNSKKELAVWGNEARKLGLLNDETFWNNVGQYFPFMYSTKEFADNSKKLGVVNVKKLRSDLSGYKQKLTDYEMGMKVLKNKLGSWPSSLEKIKNNYTEAQIKQIGIDTRKEMGLIETAAYPVKKRLDQMIQSVYTTKAMNAIAKVPGIIGDRISGYIQMPESKQYGDLSGKWVPERLGQELTALSKQPGDLGRIIQNINTIWKTMKVPYNPATIARNIQSNILLTWLSDTQIYNPTVVGRGIKAFITQDDTYRVLRDHGLYTGSYSKNELKELAFQLSDKKLENIIAWASKIYQKPGQLYGAIEDVFKTIMATDALKKGYSPDAAVEYANKWLFDYGKVSKVTEGLRQTANPFITFTAKAFPRLIETVVRKPEKLIIIGSIIGGINAANRIKLGITEEEEKQQKPAYLNKPGMFTMLLPDRDKYGQLQFLDLSYINPWGGIMQQGTSGLPQAIEPGGVVPSLYNAYIANYDPFFKQDIAPSYLPTGQQQVEKAKYVGRQLLPSLSPGGYGYTKIEKSLKGEGDYAGRVTPVKNAVLSSVAGIKIVPGGKREVEKKTNQIDRDIRDIKSEISMTFKNKGLNQERKEQTIRKLEGYIVNKQQELQSLSGGGNITNFNNIVRFIDDNGNMKTIDISFQPSAPTLTGNTELDKKAISKYRGEITSKANDIYELYQQGQLSAVEAEKKLTELKELQTKVTNSTKKPKKLKAIKMKAIKLPKIKLKKTKMPKVKKIKTKKLKTYSLKRAKLAK